MTAGIDIALARIAEEAVAKTGTLDLGCLGLFRLPDELFELSHLRTLNLGEAFLSEDGIWYDLESKLTPNNLDRDLSRLSQLPTLCALYLLGVELASLQPVQDLANLQVLYFSECNESDLAPLQSLSRLRELSCGAKVEDLMPLQGSTGLRHLDCSGPQVSDLAPISSLKKVQILYFEDT